MNRNIETGHIAELIACAILEEQGFKTSFCQQEAVDILAYKDNDFYRVQVKGSKLRKIRNYNHLQFQLGLGKAKRLPTINDYDFAVLTSIDQRKCFFMPVEEVDRTTIRKRKIVFDDLNIEEFSLTETLKKIHKRKNRSKLKWRL